MKFRRHIEIEHGLRQFDIAPLLDIVFLLLIFFMLTSSFIRLPAIDVNLPEASTGKMLKQQNFIITISAENVVYFNNKVISNDELEKRLLKALKNNIPVLIQTDRVASVGRVVEIWDICKKLGISKINIATIFE